MQPTVTATCSGSFSNGLLRGIPQSTLVFPSTNFRLCWLGRALVLPCYAAISAPSFIRVFLSRHANRNTSNTYRTPVQNNLKELHTVVDWVTFGGLLGPYPDFKK